MKEDNEWNNNAPIVLKETYEVQESSIGYSYPVLDKDGCVDHYQECTKEELEVWYAIHRKATK